MPKAAEKYYQIDPWRVVEEGYDKEQSLVSESIFSLANEYMGVRGYFEEGYGGKRLTGCYINGVYEEKGVDSLPYKGISDRITFMVNSVDWLYTRIYIDGEKLDLQECKIADFRRVLDMKRGLLSREFIWETRTGKRLKLEFQRFLSMVNTCTGYQRLKFKPLNFSGEVEIVSGLDFSIPHEAYPEAHWNCLQKGRSNEITAILAQTGNSKIGVFSGFELGFSQELPPLKYIEEELLAGVKFKLRLDKNKETFFDKKVVNYWQQGGNFKKYWSACMEEAAGDIGPGFDQAFQQQTDYWEDIWQRNDISIKGDEENQQGIRYCIYQLWQTFQGKNPGLNIGAKGLTGEAYSGHTFWDTEIYCLPFYLFNNQTAARNLLLFRYKGLDKARERAGELDCSGACYPVATLDGAESCTQWQHSNLQLQPTTAVAYAIWHYYQITHDSEFLYNQGVEMLIEISRFLADRCQQGQKTGRVGYYGVMGPDEFQLMVNHNCYTNYMARKTFIFTVDLLEEMKKDFSQAYSDLVRELSLNEEEIFKWRKLAEEIYIPLDEKTGIYEQHQGFFDLPHIEIDSIPESGFPLYNHWSYDRIYRNDMIKQPDVLMFMFLYNQEFSFESKKANYEYYEPRCIHESSLSPSIHSILAAGLNKNEDAIEFFKFATRLDLDNYNRNTGDGLHLTSIAAAWMNTVYGFGGLRSDGDIITFKPSIPDIWDEFSFKISYNGSLLKIRVDRNQAEFKVNRGPSQTIKVYNDRYEVTEEGIKVKLS